MDIEIKKYNSTYKSAWDSFVKYDSKNTSFLFMRDFMEYHQDRFEDYSLLIFKKNVLVALLPANISVDKILNSHQGLTYGGLVVKKNARLGEVIEIFLFLLKYSNEIGIQKLILKLIPSFYNNVPAEELHYILFLINAKLIRRDTSLCIRQDDKIAYQERRKRSIKKATKNNFEITTGQNAFAPFWNEVLSPNLLQKHSVKPVHSLEEIQLLNSRFPKNIKQYNVVKDEICVAGCTLFLNDNVAHAQYISGSDIGRNDGYLDYLFDYLINKEFSEYRFFDFGICNEDGGRKINHGLLDWKEGFGARTACHDFYEIETSSYKFLTPLLP